MRRVEMRRACRCQIGVAGGRAGKRSVAGLAASSTGRAPCGRPWLLPPTARDAHVSRRRIGGGGPRQLSFAPLWFVVGAGGSTFGTHRRRGRSQRVPTVSAQTGARTRYSLPSPVSPADYEPGRAQEKQASNAPERQRETLIPRVRLPGHGTPPGTKEYGNVPLVQPAHEEKLSPICSDEGPSILNVPQVLRTPGISHPSQVQAPRALPTRGDENDHERRERHVDADGDGLACRPRPALIHTVTDACLSPSSGGGRL